MQEMLLFSAGVTVVPPVKIVTTRLYYLTPDIRAVRLVNVRLYYVVRNGG